MSLTYGSVCSGIEAASAAWKPLGWRCAFMSEIEAFPRAVLQHHYPEVPLHGDFTTIQGGAYEPIDLLVGGTPCQSFSVAGLRGGLDDDRGNLALEYLRLADRLRPRWLVWENVPGVLSSNGGRDFGAILGGMVELGYGFAYRVLDAQFFGVAQRRRRVFVVGYLGDWRRAAAVLFERYSLQGHPAPRREAGQRASRPIAAGSPAGSGYRNDADTAENLIAYSIMPQNSGKDYKAREVDVAQPIMAGGPVGGNQGGDYIVQPVDLTNGLIGGDVAGTLEHAQHKSNRGQAVAYGIRSDASRDGEAKTPSADAEGNVRLRNPGMGVYTELAPTVDASQPHAVAFALRGREGGAMPEVGGDQVGSLRASSGGSSRDYVAFDTTQITSAASRSNPQPGDPCHPLAAGAHPPAVAFAHQGGGVQTRLGYDPESGTCQTLSANQTPAIAGTVHSHTRPGSNEVGSIVQTSAVRRLTPVECERLQGFADGYTDIPWRGRSHAPDGPRYKALGNSMAVPVMAWIGRRIAAVEALSSDEAAA